MARVEIQPASISQVHRTRVGRNVAVDLDVHNVARDLHDIDPSLRLEYDPVEEFFIIFQRRVLPNGDEQDTLVTTAQELDQRIVQRVREITSPSYDFAAELDRVDAAAERARRHEFAERMGDGAERLAHALAKDLGVKRPRAFKPGS